MSANQTFHEKIRQLIASDEINEAIQLLQQLLKNSPKLNEAILQSSRLSDISRQIRLGMVDDNQANITKNKIRSGILELLEEIEAQETALPAVQGEVAQFAAIHISRKNIVTGNVSAGGNIIIGDTQTTIDRQVNIGGGTYIEQQTVNRSEDTRSRYIKYALFGFALPGLFLFLLYWYFVLSRPFNLSVSVLEAHPVPGLPFKEGSVTLRFGDKTENLPIVTETIFKQIPASQKNETARLTFEAPGYQTIDTTFLLSENLLLPIRRDNSLARIFGTVRDDQGSPLADVQISVQDITISSDVSGHFLLDIPFEKQRTEQRVLAIKPGYKPWDFTFPVMQEEVRIILPK